MALTQINSNSIADGSITNADISSSAAIDESKLTITSVGGANGVDFNDNVKARFGTGNDLAIYHDGSNSYIREAGTGDLLIQGVSVVLESTTGENYIHCANNGKVTLYWDNVSKLTTEDYGIDVTGSVTCDGLTSDGTTRIRGGSPQLVLQDTDSTSDATTGTLVMQDSGGNSKWLFGDYSTANQNLYVYNYGTADVVLSTNASGKQISLTSAGHWVPADNNAQDLGTSTNKWRNAYIDGTVNCDGLTCNGSATIQASTGVLVLKDVNNANSTNHQTYISGRDSGDTQRWYIGNISDASADVQLVNAGGASLKFGTNNTERCYVDANGHFKPIANDSYDLGSSGLRWRNVYTNDLNLSNEGGSNDVDGTWGSWTIQEGEDDLFLLNRRNGKKYKFNLTEVN